MAEKVPVMALMLNFVPWHFFMVIEINPFPVKILVDTVSVIGELYSSGRRRIIKNLGHKFIILEIFLSWVHTMLIQKVLNTFRK